MLDQLVNTQKENNKRLASIEQSVNALVKVNVQTANREKVESKRRATAERRSGIKLEQSPAKKVAAKVKEKKEQKGFLNGLMDSLKKGALGVAIGGAVVAALSNEDVRKAIGKAFETLTPIFMDIAAKMAEMLWETGKKIIQGMGRGLFGDYSNDAADRAMADPNATEEEIEKIKKLKKAIAEKTHKEKEYYRWKFDAKKKEAKGDEEGAKRSLKFAEAEKEKVQSQIDEIQALKELAVAKGIATEADFRLRSAQEVNQRMGWFEKNTWEGRFSPQGLQRGGPVRVPGSGNGDKVPAIVPAGSFVMNKIATGALGFQEGGQVPVMLEPGESVYGPGSFGPMEMAMNSIIPRFQSGGFVGSTNVVNTGYKDYKGRPAMLSPSAAEGVKCMIEKGMKWNAADVANVYRDRSEYQRLLNAGYSPATRSKHNFGEAMDVHGSMGQWIRSKGKDCGWGPHDYAGSHGGHYEFFGSRTQSPARDETYGDKAQNDPGGVKGETAGNLGERMAEAAGPAGGLFSNPVTTGLGNVMNTVGGAAMGGLRAAGLPGLADLGEIFAEGFKQSKLGPLMGSVIGGAFSGLQGLFSMFGIGSAPARAAQAPQASPFTSMGRSGNLGGSALGGMNAPASASAPSTAITGGGKYGVDSLRKAMDESGITDATERAMFLAQMAHESGNFRYKEEIWGPTPTQRGYEGRSDLGNTQPGDGKRFRGRGYIQLTGRDNYTRYGNKIGVDLANNPDLAADPTVAAKIAIQYWMDRVDRGAARGGDITTVTKNINGGTNGLADRMHYFEKYRGQGLQTGGLVNMSGATSGNMKRYQQAMETFQSSMAANSQPIIVPVPMGGGGDGGGAIAQVTGGMGTPEPPSLPEGPNVVALLELQNRLALGAAL